MINKSKLTKSSLMLSRLRLSVPILWVLTLSLTFAAARTSSGTLSSQLWSTDPQLIPGKVNKVISFDIFANLVDQCTHLEWSCDVEQKMSNLTKEQKQVG